MYQPWLEQILCIDHDFVAHAHVVAALAGLRELEVFDHVIENRREFGAYYNGYISV